MSEPIDRETMADAADFERKRLRESSSCYGCGSPDPVRIEGNRCSDCYDGWPRCVMCGRWLDLKGSMATETDTTADGECCRPCAQRWLLSLPA